VVIVSRFDPEAPRALIIYVPLTTQNRQSSYEVSVPKLGFLNADSVANVQGIASMPPVRLERRLGMLPAGILARFEEHYPSLWNWTIPVDSIAIQRFACLSMLPAAQPGGRQTETARALEGGRAGRRRITDV
jgi:hypothetical protein